ncbi:hypothetical protein ACFQPG_07390 [Sphingomonas sp. GCM10030256]|uniref:hypothetical protein n=1 Tax=Sphingomonas sp. GCM10030256 TaxID=3273427 RepID=UPI00361208D9
MTADERQRLLGADMEKVERWRAQPFRVPLRLVVLSISLLMTHKAILKVIGEGGAAGEWLRVTRLLAPFNGDSTLSLILAEGRRGIVLLRDHLDQEAIAGELPEMQHGGETA